ncbi:non-ribosomal peptide synthetase [Tengunoibacter tsumagoiensis]|uniref:Carrier domain-containing protein n=1 Tax=Tengunoibacter tsumagoiensis TaxID=2014871 RepID=A0A402A982_9CHLR|nr:non-ribosomal peptide synthetase [Tengunoibacter tsumagoiensis]GCE15703.1 hypothetical protein KTT_55620 [Tengunoibacter tsumagoiensis]
MSDDLSKRISSLSPEKIALLARQISSQKKELRPEPLPRDTNRFPVSFAQQRLWFLDRLVPNNSVYNVPAALHMTGELHIQALTDSITTIIRRHEVLRTTFTSIKGEPQQVIASKETVPAVPLIVVSLEHFSPPERKTVSRQFIDAFLELPFDLSSGPLLRIALLKLQPEEHILLLSMHHIVSDGWSIGIFIRELTTCYEHFARGTTPHLPALPLQYADFAVWQRSWLQDNVLERQLAYWRKELAGAPTILHLPTDHPRPAIQTFKGTKYFFSVELPILEQLKQISRLENTTLFMTLLALFAVLLARYTDQETILLGSGVANRNREEIEGLIGFFVNTLLVRVDLTGNPGTRQLLQRVRTATLGAYANQDLPFEKIVAELHPARDMSRMPLCQVAFILQNAPRAAISLAGLELSPVEISSNTTKFDLTLDTVETPSGLKCCFEYSTDLFEATTIERLSQHWLLLLKAAVAVPDQPIHYLELLSPQERSLLIDTWNRPGAELLPEALCAAHTRFEEQVQQQPDAIAAVYLDQHISYQAFNKRANQLAHYLEQRGVGPEVFVGVYMEKSLEMLISILAILKANGVYVPIDPSYPPARLQYILADAQLHIVLTNSSLSATIADHERAIICLDTEKERIEGEESDNIRRRTSPQSSCYVIYTSGSTGLPKAVLLHHAGLCHLVAGQIQALGLSTSDHIIQLASFSFDASVSEIFITLGAGATLYLAHQEQLLLESAMATFVQTRGITTLTISPSVLATFSQEAFQSLRALISAGEPCPPALAAYWSRHCAFFNAYGPTEGTVCATMTQYHPAMGKPAIGRPLPHVTTYVLDAYMQPVPVGVPGELYIGGAGLAHGYLHRPDSTAARFRPHPFSHLPGERLYKTGDLVRYLPDGNLEYLERMDQQVKIRGIRIEPGEIEYILNQHPAVQQAVVMSKGETAEDKHIVAYLIASPENHSLSAAAQDQQRITDAAQEQVSQWQHVFDQIFQRPHEALDPTFNIGGWNSSYTGQPFSPDEMHTWVDTTVQRIKELQPEQIYEIGCGSGLLLFPLLESCERYVGCDISANALNVLRQGLQHQERADRVTLLQHAADDFSGREPEEFDLVLLNSVIQYFPDVSYLLQILQGAIQLVRPGGHIFIGDVRSLSLLEAFHTSVELERTPTTLPLEQLTRAIQRRLAQETELAVDPAFFSALARYSSAITGVTIQMKRGSHNELTTFRYDVVLHIGQQPPDHRIAIRWHDWPGSWADLQQRIRENSEPLIAWRGIPNKRTLQASQSVHLLHTEPDRFPTILDLRRALADQQQAAIDPEEIWQFADRLGYQAHIQWSAGRDDGSFDVLLSKTSSAPHVSAPYIQWFRTQDGEEPDWRSYTNVPLQEQQKQQLISHVTAFVQERLPRHMVPATYIVLKHLPLTPHGKVDRHALLALGQTRMTPIIPYIAPRTEIEQTIADIWREILQIEKVGVDDNFFDLGGHSLRMAQLHNRLLTAFEKKITLIDLFQYPTLRTQAQYFAHKQPQNAAQQRGQIRAQNRRGLQQRRTDKR